MKKLFIYVLILVVVISALYVILNIKKAFDFTEKVRDKGIGKNIQITVDSNSYDSKRVRKEINLWPNSEKEKFVQYLEKNNLRIKEGMYTINQATTFEEAIKIFKFEKIKIE